MTRTIVKFGVFVTVMTTLTAFLFMTFSQYRGGATSRYSAVFEDASRLESGDSVRVAGVRVGTVRGVALQPDKTVLVDFDADRGIQLTEGTRAAVRYLNLTGDRYLELLDEPGSTRLLPAGSRIPKERTAPALDLDLLLGGLRPVINGLNPQDVNALTSALVQIFQGQGDTLDSLMSKTSSFSTSLADSSQAIQQLIDNLRAVVDTLEKDGDKFSGAIDQLEQLVSGLAEDRDPIGTAITALDQGTASMADLLSQARPPLDRTVNELNRLAPLLADHQIVFDRALQRGPENYRKLARLGSYGSWIMYYICGISFRVTDLEGRTAVFPMVKQEGGRCAEP
ncbi:MCE family protein [Mycolicibacterium thermoresistibile]|jgi:phospholipid/cholesterol/gamma-HCH transport system substrate-binding protein|uniref:Virulence factor Mce family protein n=2 Tax=Mycolicibacterium thermoresistibile TaxID=1797 RepID=G7CJS5_MYCT3|nr:MCE family protein [Mycolicibacterium thermoresistibile]EHI12793.1 virulence factor Mce family protein [Mycolicibacterium thermoresistibile ATCC 19527]MCV7189950.1 MCE family protein [Mycolicibacterium thermoresistibile]GAT13997.1 virulence factor Mce family protein [Mycolicibacterium thermoresistibile]SNW19169.1 Virulence factor Mce family protein [Mycolicibacterium thermoresistibile]